MSRRSLPLAPSGESRIAVAEQAPRRPEGWGEQGIALTDAHGRRITYLRASITDRCNMACVYCMPPGGEDEHAMRSDVLAFEELVAITRALATGGVRRVRLTGGEPLARRDVVRLVAMLRAGTPIEALAMTTNGARLTTLARPLREAGLDEVNVSIDSLDRDRFRAITRGGDLDEVLAGVHAALDAGMVVKINCVALGGLNDDELGAIVDWAWSIGIVPRFIELMPIGEAAALPRERFVAAREIVSRLGARVAPDASATKPDGKGPARYLAAADGSGREVGFITAVSDEFCGGCNRVRITSRGELRACLASRRAVSLRDLVREGASDLDVLWATAWSLGVKDTGHHFADVHADEHERVGMSLIGG
ncbi:GTP 3',8-cyclase MoaA [Sandaracinus amylolyticus]|uniref:GTP 3',8-cyclase n=1 Tax=Sandaracinus amylolyticus TaxID=927083 RepID=A0A0F6SFW5_9BACT|nr:GTP 3',8-cyclase MoaA [Sandaracinus amylolyticus]AKF07654.1 Molybdenum cofactor biosynthesis protein MoaA [Sandaracinus amylolyticus]